MQWKFCWEKNTYRHYFYAMRGIFKSFPDVSLNFFFAHTWELCSASSCKTHLQDNIIEQVCVTLDKSYCYFAFRKKVKLLKSVEKDLLKTTEWRVVPMKGFFPLRPFRLYVCQTLLLANLRRTRLTASLGLLPPIRPRYWICTHMILLITTLCEGQSNAQWENEVVKTLVTLYFTGPFSKSI